MLLLDCADVMEGPAVEAAASYATEDDWRTGVEVDRFMLAIVVGRISLDEGIG